MEEETLALWGFIFAGIAATGVVGGLIWAIFSKGFGLVGRLTKVEDTVRPLSDRVADASSRLIAVETTLKLVVGGAIDTLKDEVGAPEEHDGSS